MQQQSSVSNLQQTSDPKKAVNSNNASLYLQILAKHIPELAASAISFITGLAMILDDSLVYKDWGKTDKFWHHGYLGIPLFLGGLGGIAIVLYKASLEMKGAQANTVPKRPIPMNFIKPEMLKQWA